MRICFIILGTLLTCSVALALPPEGFENFSLLGRGQSSGYVVSGLGHQTPAWRPEFQSAYLYGGFPAGTDYATFGARTTVSPEFGDRDAYFARYDFVMLKTTSFSLKWMHENWNYIASAKESLGLEYNAYFGFNGAKSGIYASVGGYYRWLKQRWNEPWWSPLNLNTEDSEGYFVAVLGWQSALGQGGSHFTFDMNNRDPYSYYSMDNVAFDFGLNLDAGRFIWRLQGGVRTAALFMGTGSISETYGSIGFVLY